jgi:hypothetical protein
MPISCGQRFHAHLLWTEIPCPSPMDRDFLHVFS